MWISPRSLRFGSIRDKAVFLSSNLFYNVSHIWNRPTFYGMGTFSFARFLGGLMKTAVSTVTTKGQLVIPSKLRRKYGIRKGTRVAMIEEENRIILQPLTRAYIHSLRGSFKGEKSMLQFLKEGRMQDRTL